jgi:hypothetical protein
MKNKKQGVSDKTHKTYFPALQISSPINLVMILMMMMFVIQQ